MPQSAIQFIERAADACYAAADDRRAWELYQTAAAAYRAHGAVDGAVRCAEQMARLRAAKGGA